MAEERDEAEARIKSAFDAGDFEAAATLTIERYGREILGFLVTQLRDADEASEVFSEFSEEFWKTLPRFEWRCSARTWAYKLARRCAGHHRDKNRRREARQTGLTHASRLSQAVAKVRTATMAHMKTEVKDKFQQLREKLPPEDQMVLILRVDRRLSWLELAEVMAGEDASASEDELKREAARLRKRFQLSKDRLRKMAEEEGLLQ